MPYDKTQPEKLKPLLQNRNDALDLLSVAESVLQEWHDDKLEYILENKDAATLEKATATLKKALLGEYDDFGVRKKVPVSLGEMAGVSAAFEKTVNSLPFRARDHFRTKLFHKQDDREERLEKSYNAYVARLEENTLQPLHPRRRPLPYVDKPKDYTYEGIEEEHEPVKDETKWPTIKDSPGIKREPTKEDNELWLKLLPAISEIVNLPSEPGRKLGPKLTDHILDELDKNLSFEEFKDTAYDLLPFYYHAKNLEATIARKKEELSDAKEENQKRKIEKELVRLEERSNAIKKMDSNLKFLHENWKPEQMENQSNLVKNIGQHYRLVLGTKEITLETAWLSASIKFSTSSAACKKFIELSTEKDIEATFDVATLIALEKQAADVASLVRPGTRGPSAEEEKPMVTAIVEWLNAKGAQGTEQDIEKMASEYLSSKAPDYAEEDVARVARKVYAEWKASQPIPSEVGQEGKANVGVANMGGTGTYVEPNRGDTGVQNEAPTATVRKEAAHEGDWWCVTCGKEISPKEINEHNAKGHSVQWLGKPAKRASAEEAEVCTQCDMGAHERCSGGTCACGVCKEKKKLKKEAEKRCKKCTKQETSYRPLDENGLCEDCRKASSMKKEASMNDQGGLDYADEGEIARAKANDLVTLPKNVKGTNCANCKFVKLPEKFCAHPKIQLKVTERMCCALWDADGTYRQWEEGGKMEKEADLLIIARIVKREDGWHVMSEKGKHLGGPYKSRKAAKKRLQQVEMFKHMKGGAQEESLMVFNTGEAALLNKKVGALDEGTEVTVTSCSEDEVSFTAGDILGITKLANLDKIVILKEAASKEEKYPWDNDGLDYKFNLNDRVRVGSTEYDGMDLKGKEGTIRDKVIVAANGDAEKFYTVELDGCGTATLPEEVLSKLGKSEPHAWREAALNHTELSKAAVIKPNFDAAQEFLNSYDHPPTVVTTEDIENWFADPKNNYQYSKKDLKEIVKYLQSAKVEVRVPVKKETPEVLPEEATEAPAMEKEAKQYKAEQIGDDGSHTTITKDTPADLGPSFETEDPSKPGQKIKWTAASLEKGASCSKCAGVGTLPCPCMEDALWLSKSCAQCGDEGSLKCPACK